MRGHRLHSRDARPMCGTEEPGVFPRLCSNHFARGCMLILAQWVPLRAKRPNACQAPQWVPKLAYACRPPPMCTRTNFYSADRTDVPRCRFRRSVTGATGVHSGGSRCAESPLPSRPAPSPRDCDSACFGKLRCGRVSAIGIRPSRSHGQFRDRSPTSSTSSCAHASHFRRIASLVRISAPAPIARQSRPPRRCNPRIASTFHVKHDVHAAKVRRVRTKDTTVRGG